ncbi:MAG: Uma2 family endonuclease [Chloroflexota bacterium]|nr:Uma2 family endonuclease [Chloroflexota bacterium]
MTLEMTMPVAEAATLHTEAETVSVPLTRRRFSVADYYRMLESGILTEEDRVELIDGEIVEMSPINSIHAANVDRLNFLLFRQIEDKAIVRIQNPVHLDDYNEPQPDLALVRWRDDFYEQSHPTAADVLVAIEVANTSLLYDRKKKLPLYAQAGIPEVWLVNVGGQTIEQYWQPVNGYYTRNQVMHRGAMLTAQTIPDLQLPVDQIFGKFLDVKSV